MTRRPLWSEAQHAAAGSRADRLPPSRPHVLERGHHPIACPCPYEIDDRPIQLIKSQLGIFQRLADGINDLLRLRRRQPDAVGKGRLRRDG